MSKHSVINGGGINFISPSVNSTLSIRNTQAMDILPEVIIDDFDEHGNKIAMEFDPDPNITAFEAVKLMHMFAAWAGGVTSFSPYLFIKKMHYERHFKIS